MKRLLLSPLTGKIYLTNAKEIEGGFLRAVGEKQDYTDEAIRVVYEWFLHNATQSNDGFYQIKFSDKPWLTIQIEKAGADNA